MAILDDKPKRLREIRKIMRKVKYDLKEEGHDIIYKEDSAKKIIDNYEVLLADVFRKFNKKNSKIDASKTASGTEVATVYTQPISYPANFADEIRFNSILAFSIGTYLMFSLSFEELLRKHTPDLHFIRYIKEINSKHLDWLDFSAMTGLYSFPVYSNAVFWEMYASYFEMYQKLSKINHQKP